MEKDDRSFAPLRRLKRIRHAMRSRVTGEEGQGLAEYAFILLLVAVACVGALGMLKDGILGGLDAAANMFP